jgi:hypothetical protein
MSAIVACSIDARWAASDAYLQPMNSTTVSSNVSDRLIETMQASNDPVNIKFGFSNAPIDLQLDWANLLNGNQSREADNSTTNRAAIPLMLDFAVNNITETDNTTATFMAPNATATGEEIEEAIAMLLGIIVADGISRTTSQENVPVLVTERKPDVIAVTYLQSYLLPSGTREFSPAGLDTFKSVRIKLDQYGYGYAIRGATTWVAIVVLLSYALVVLVHVVVVLYAWFRKQYYGGECWENVADLVALAMNSSPTDKLNGTSAGVENSDTWESIVKIRETGGQHLELCFVGSEHADGQSVLIGKKYL